MSSATMLAPANETGVLPIQFIDLKAQQARIRPEIEAAIMRVLDHGAYVMGPEIGALETALAGHTGAAAVVGVGNGTDALEIALMGEGVGPGDAVFIPAFTYNATANAVLLAGASPVFVDIAADTFNMDPAALSAAIARIERDGKLTPKVVIPVDLYGRPADYAPILSIAGAHGLTVIGDAAQSFGGIYAGKKVGAIAPITCTSFFPAKALGGYGDGGAIFTTDPEKAELWRSIRFHGTDENRRTSVRVGFNGRLDTFQAAIVLVKLSIFAEEWAARDRIARIYAECLGGAVGLAKDDPQVTSGWGLYTVLLPEGADRAAIQAALKEKGVPTAVYYPLPLHQHPAFAAHAPAGGLPVTEMCATRVLSLPMHPYLTEAQGHYVCYALLAAL